MRKEAANECYLLVDGQVHCRVLEVEICPPLFGRSQQRLLLDKPLWLALLDSREFRLRLAGGQELAFDAYESGEDGMSLLGCPGAASS